MEETKQNETKKFDKQIIIDFAKKHYKKLIAASLAIVILVVSGVLLFQHNNAPKIEDVYDRMVYLIEASQEVNAIIYGCGVPVWEDDSEYVEFMHVYYGLDPARDYEIVMPNAKYLSVQQMKEAIEEIYTKEYLDEVIYRSIFDGFAIENGACGAVVGVARYYEEGAYLWQSKDFKTYYTGMRVYDYSTMQVHSLGKTDRCVITVNSWLEDTPDKIETVEILIALQDGEWYLDNFIA